jgi:DNA polymerase phi
MLYSLAMLQLYDGDTDAPGILQDLNAYQKNLRRKSSKLQHAEESDPMLEILLSFASKPSRFFHQTGLQAFRTFSSQLSRSGLQALIRVCQSEDGIGPYSRSAGLGDKRKLAWNSGHFRY